MTTFFVSAAGWPKICLAVIFFAAAFAAIPFFGKTARGSYALYALLCLGSSALVLLLFAFTGVTSLLYALLALLATSSLAAFSVEALAYGAFSRLAPAAAVRTLVAIFALYAGLSLLFGRVWAGVLAGNIMLYILGTVNHFTMRFRGEAFIPADIAAAGTAANVLGGYRLTPNAPLCTALAAFVFTIAAATHVPPLPFSGVARLISASCGLALVFAFFGFTTCARRGRSSGSRSGYLLHFLSLLGSKRHKAPNGYSDEAFLRSAANVRPVTETNAQPRPDIWLVMNESLADFTRFGNLPLEADPLTFFHRLKTDANTYVGRLAVPVFGGGTSSTEFEAVTGFSRALCPSAAAPYKTLAQTSIPSLARHLAAQGYTCEAMHIENAKNWNRDTAYPNMGFSHFYDETAVSLPQSMTLRTFATDEAHYSVLREEADCAPQENPYFNFSITMQNHGGYTVPMEQRRAWLPPYMKFPQAEQYFELTSRSDEALKTLQQIVAARARPTVALVFGDHLPCIEQEFYDILLGKPRCACTPEELFRLYETPVAAFANFPMDSAALPGFFSANYLPAVLTKVAGLPQTPFETFLANSMGKMPVFSLKGFLDNEGKYCETLLGTQHEPLLNEYAIWQYAGLARYGTTHEMFL